jgi:hypothetical protein
MTWLYNSTALRSLKLMEDVVVDMIDVFHVLPLRGDADTSRTAHCQLINHHESSGTTLQHLFSVRLPRLPDFSARPRHGFNGRSPRCPPEILAQCRSGPDHSRNQ